MISFNLSLKIKKLLEEQSFYSLKFTWPIESVFLCVYDITVDRWKLNVIFESGYGYV